MRQRDAWIVRIKEVEREYLVARSAEGLLGERLKENPRWGEPYGWQQRDAQVFTLNLEGTYLVRMFTVFEGGLRSYWWGYRGRSTEPPSRDLIDSAAAYHHIRVNDREAVHRIRVSRNALVHESGDDEDRLSLVESRASLCRFFCKLPGDWEPTRP